jgi:uncharacterized secreted protein with C-terminal beta-propeller domain
MLKLPRNFRDGLEQLSAFLTRELNHTNVAKADLPVSKSASRSKPSEFIQTHTKDAA